MDAVLEGIELCEAVEACGALDLMLQTRVGCCPCRRQTVTHAILAFL